VSECKEISKQEEVGTRIVSRRSQVEYAGQRNCIEELDVYKRFRI
jgi:hypothetical protein